MAGYLKEGSGWRLGWNPDAPVFQGLLGGADWAVELTADEFQDFCRLTRQLVETLAAIAPELMAEERIACELETERLWVEMEGDPKSYELRFIVLTGRRVEGAWPPSAAIAVVGAIALATFV